jgi:uncharacterized membrane protein
MRIRDWTLKEIAQGKPWAHPTHAMFIHFPTALYPTALAFGLISLLQRSEHAADAAALTIGLGILATVPASFTGLLDWSGMVPSSTKRRVATRHMLFQVTALSLACVSLALFVVDTGGPAPVLGLLALAAAVGVMVGGNWLGGVLVYRMAMRVGGSREPSRLRARPAPDTNLRTHEGSSS